MKTNEINKLINETLLKTVKDIILREQQEVAGSLPILGCDCMKNKIKKFDQYKKDDGHVFDIDIDGVNKDEAFRCHGVDNVNDLQRQLSTGLHNNLRKVHSKPFDIDIEPRENEDNIGFGIKIISSEMLGENMEKKKITSFFDALTEAKRNKKKTFIFEENEINVEECWKDVKSELEECGKMDKYEIGEEESCDECDKKSMEEEEESCDECNKMKMEGKKVLKLTESELFDVIRKIIKESDGVPGISVTDQVKKEDKKENDEYLNSVDKKLKKYLSFDGNDNPEFPGQIGTGEVAGAYRNKSEDQEYIDNNRGGTNLDLDYDAEPTEQFVERVRKALTGDSEMGNSSKDTGNTIETKTGEDMMKKAEVKKDAKEKMPMYKKDPQPVKEVNENKEEEKQLINEEVERMKTIFNYNKKTQ